MTRKDIPFMSSTLRKIRESYSPHRDPNLLRACDDHAKKFAEELSYTMGQSFDKDRFLRDAGVKPQP